MDALLKAGADPDVCSCSCVTALHRAVQQQHVEVVARLLEAGASPRLWYDGRFAPVDLARQTGNAQIIKLIERALANPGRQHPAPGR